MYDPFTSRYTFACPSRGDTRVSLSAFRELERLPGTAHPAVYRVTFACPCGDDHSGLVAHDELDWAPLGLAGGLFFNVMTARLDEVAPELRDLASRRIGAGEWPWTFFCYPEARARPVFPSAFCLIAPGGGALGVAVRCPSCDAVSINLVSPEHVDLPFHHDVEVGVVEHVLAHDRDRAVAEFRAELDSARFDSRRLSL